MILTPALLVVLRIASLRVTMLSFKRPTKAALNAITVRKMSSITI